MSTPELLAADVDRYELMELREVFRTHRDGILVCDADLKLVRVNEGFLRMSHRTLRDLVGHSAEDIFYRLSIFGSRATFWDNLRREGRHELQFRSPSGKRAFHLVGNRIRRNGAGGYALMLRETTSTQVLQEKFLQTEKLGALANVLSKMANQLNNPLQSVVGFADVLAARTDDPRWLENVRFIQRESRRTAQVLKSLLLFSRRVRPELARLNVNPFVDDVVREWGSHAPSPRVAIEVMGAIESPVVSADAFQLEQVLRHLLNHLHHSLAVEPPAGGGVLRVMVERDLSHAVISVGHNGAVVPRHRLRRMFEPDFQVPPESRETGLELAICRDVIQAHGGSIDCLSSPGMGTRFVFALPLAAGFDTSFQQRSIIPPVATRVMVIDDEPSIGALLREMLAVEDYQPECFTSAREALVRLEEVPFDVILCDLNMPEMNGKEFFRRLQKDKPALASRVVFATGDLLSDHPDLFPEGHAHDVLPKPFKMDQLLGTIERKLRRVGISN